MDTARTRNGWRPAPGTGLAFGLFAAVALGVFTYFFVYGKSLVWSVDGLEQHIPALHYYNTWLRSILHDPAAAVPLWSWEMGLGSDILSVLSFHVVGDPFVLLSLAFPLRHLEYAYAAMHAARVLVACGLTFAYLRRMGARVPAATAGAIVYVFSTFVMFSVVRHPFFANALLSLPLLLLGIEAALAKRRSWLLTVAAAVAAFANFYFFYMLSLIVVAYTVARYLEITPAERRWSGLLAQSSRVAGYYLAGLLIAGPVLFPGLAASFATARRGYEFSIEAFYPLREYASYVAALASSHAGPNSTFLGFSIVALLLSVVLVFRRKGHLALKTMLVVFPVFVGVPAFGSLFNGMTFATNRYSFAWGMFIALAAALLLSEEEPLAPADLLVMLAGYAVHLILLVLFYEPLSVQVLAPMGVGALAWGVFALDAATRGPSAAPRVSAASRLPSGWRMPPARWAVLGVLIAGVLGNAALLYDARYDNYLRDYVDRGQVAAQYVSPAGTRAARLMEAGSLRVYDATSGRYNDSMVQGYRGAASYFSLMNGSMSRYIVDHDIRGSWSSFSYDGFDDRASLTSLAGIDYYLADRDYPFVPYGFVRAPGGSDELAVYRNRYALPLGFVYPNVIRESDYASYNAIERQQVLLEAAVVEDTARVSVPETSVVPAVIEVPYTVYGTRGARLDLAKGTLTKRAEASKVILSFDPVPDAELYIEMSGSDDVVSPPSKRPDPALETAGKRLSGIIADQRDAGFAQPQRITTTYGIGTATKAEAWETPSSPYHWGNRSQLVNLGYRAQGADHVSIWLERIGKRTFEGLKVYAIPMSGFAEKIERLRSQPMTDTTIGTNSVTGRVTTESGGLVYLSIPYSTGWRATVDGVAAPVLRVNSAFSGIEVGPGTHEIALRYMTPGLVPGLIAAGAGIVLVAMLVALETLMRRRGSVAAESLETSEQPAA